MDIKGIIILALLVMGVLYAWPKVKGLAGKAL